ncbi:hypothetical protein STEG23_024467, partial [Scotinomys teguina]
MHSDPIIIRMGPVFWFDYVARGLFLLVQPNLVSCKLLESSQFFKGTFNFLFKGLYHFLKIIFGVDFFCFFCVVGTSGICLREQLFPIDAGLELKGLGLNQHCDAACACLSFSPQDLSEYLTCDILDEC